VLHSQIAVAHFLIGSVDSFERKLQAAQDALDIDPHDHVPVSYNDSRNLLRTLLEALPTILGLGLMFFLFRGMMGMSCFRLCLFCCPFLLFQ
jgi:AFG3 family protein